MDDWSDKSSDEILKDINDALQKAWNNSSKVTLTFNVNDDASDELKYLIKYCEKRNITSLTDRKIRVILKRRRKGIIGFLKETVNKYV
jgi:ATP phosphoribosyltransferase